MMTEQSEALAGNDANGTVISEVPSRRFAVTVEIPAFCSLLATTLSGGAITNILLYRACLHSLHHTEDECRLFLSPEKANISRDIEIESQKYANLVLTASSVAGAVMPAIISLFIGVWSDTYGRKPLIVWPLFGIAISSLMSVGFVMWRDLGPWWYLLTVIPLSLTGGPIVFSTGAYCYLTDITSSKSRSIRMLFMEASTTSGYFIGVMLCAPLIKSVGNLYLFVIAAAINVFAYAYSNIYLVESLVGAIKGGLCSILDFLLVKEMIRESFKPRPNNLRAQMLLLVSANALTIFTMYGLFNVDYFYARDKVKWSLKEFNTFTATNTVISFFGGMLGIGLFQKLLKMSDLGFAIVAFLSVGTEYVIRILAVTTWHMYIGAIVSLFKGVASPLIRSFITKILPLEDITKIFALMSTIEGIFPMVSPVAYSALYNFTLATFPPAVYVLSAALTFACATMLGVVLYYRRNITTYYQPLQTEDA